MPLTVMRLPSSVPIDGSRPRSSADQLGRGRRPVGQQRAQVRVGRAQVAVSSARPLAHRRIVVGRLDLGGAARYGRRGSAPGSPAGRRGVGRAAALLASSMRRSAVLVALERRAQLVDDHRRSSGSTERDQRVEVGQQRLRRQRHAGPLARDHVAVAQVRPGRRVSGAGRGTARRPPSAAPRRRAGRRGTRTPPSRRSATRT